jgi:predicted ribosome quality control (RQC) complex YloA/Tae2 family protein|tara:strand:+ start:360 stop:755 length:396 start_codon:yes stop_codon:yes gene_type:complete
MKRSKKVKFRKFTTDSGTYGRMGTDEKSNDELMKEFEGKKNKIIHTSKPGSPFGVIENTLNPTKFQIIASGAQIVGHSQDWRDNKGDVKIDVFTGKDISKKWWMKSGTWKVKKSKKIKIKKKDIENANNRE